MSFSVGLRFYKIYVSRRRSGENFILNRFDGHSDLYEFLDSFAIKSEKVTINEDQRSFRIEKKRNTSDRVLHGLIHYGTHGFESEIVDLATQNLNYKRQTSDVEVVPLYFQFWIPDEHDFAIGAFQSFQGKSCKTMIVKAIREDFQTRYPHYSLHFAKLCPEDIEGGRLGSANVKELKFLHRRSPSDSADRYLNGISVDEVDIEVTIKAPMKRFMGTYDAIKAAAKSGQKTMLLQFEGNDYASLRATVDLAGRRRVVGVFGPSADTGIIEVSEDVKIGLDGHPTFESMEVEVDGLMVAFHSYLKVAR